MTSVFQYRTAGNCFSNSVIKGCQLLNDTKLVNNNKPELIVFTDEILRKEGKTEYEPALNYLLKNKYQVKIMDPNPGNDYGTNLSRVNYSKKRYKISDIYRLLNQGWCVIPSVIGKDGKHTTHAILLFKDQIWDPINEESWSTPQSLQKFKKYFPNEEDNRHFFAFRLDQNSKGVEST